MVEHLIRAFFATVNAALHKTHEGRERGRWVRALLESARGTLTAFICRRVVASTVQLISNTDQILAAPLVVALLNETLRVSHRRLKAKGNNGSSKQRLQPIALRWRDVDDLNWRDVDVPAGGDASRRGFLMRAHSCRGRMSTSPSARMSPTVVC